MSAGIYTFIINQGETVDFRIQYLDSNLSPVDLTDWEARMQIRPKPGSSQLYASLSSSLTADGSGLIMTPYSGSVMLPRSSGSIGIYISAYSSSQFTFDTAHYDLEIYSGSGVRETVIRLLEGKIKLKKEVTR